MAERGLAVGDVVKIQYKAETREILLECFELHWPTGQDTEIPTLVFEGPTVQLKPRRVARVSNWCALSSSATKQPGPSAFMTSQLGDLGPR